jgi:hypothetical protein
VCLFFSPERIRLITSCSPHTINTPNPAYLAKLPIAVSKLRRRCLHTCLKEVKFNYGKNLHGAYQKTLNLAESRRDWLFCFRKFLTLQVKERSRQ